VLAGYNQNDVNLEELGAFVRISDCLFQNNSVEAQPVGTIEDSDRSGFGDEIPTEFAPLGPSLENGSRDGDDNNNNNNNNNDGKNNGSKNPPVRSLQTESQRFDTRGQLFGEQILVGRGGGMAIIINADAAAFVNVSGCVFLENVAVEFGGGLYLLLRGPTSHSVDIVQNR
jgi:hypothetical protein